jgi:hypothetical protein
MQFKSICYLRYFRAILTAESPLTISQKMDSMYRNFKNHLPTCVLVQLVLNNVINDMVGYMKFGVADHENDLSYDPEFEAGYT